MRHADADSWKHTPMPEETAELEYEAAYSLDEFERLSRGLVPHGMEDKWFVFLQDRTLQVHRSWTGHCLFQVELAERDGRHVVRRARVNRDPEQYDGRDAAYDARLLHFLIANLLLGRDEPFPVPPDAPDGSGGLFQHHVAGTAYPEDRAEAGTDPDRPDPGSPAPRSRRWWTFRRRRP